MTTLKLERVLFWSVICAGLLAVCGAVADGWSKSSKGASRSTAYAAPAACANPTFGASTKFVVGLNPNGLVLGKINGDNNLDFATAHSSPGRVAVLLGNSNGSFATPAPTSTTENFPVDVAAGDFNGDGKLDLVTAHDFPGSVAVVLGNGDGTFGAPTSFGTINFGAGALAVGKFNADNTLDIAVGGTTSNTLSLLTGNGAGGFTVPTDQIAVPSNVLFVGPASLVSGDFNGDSKLDLAAASSEINAVSVFRGNGDGTFATPAQTFSTGSNPVFITAADMEGDGKLDLLTANRLGGSIGILKGNGDGTFAAAQLFGSGSRPIGLAVGDFDGDGKPDVAVVNSTGNDLTIMKGNGDGSVTPLTDHIPTGFQPTRILTADFNGDTQLDLALTSDTNSVEVLLNACNVPSTPTPTATVSGPPPTPTSTSTPTGPAPTATATPTGGPCKSEPFSDVNPSDYFSADVTWLFCRNAISGYTDGTFRPFNNATRAQLVKIVVVAEGFQLLTPTVATFSDVTTANAFFPYVETAVNRQIVSGYGDGTFRPYNSVTRGQATKIIVQAEGWQLLTPANPTFSDVATNNAFFSFIETAAAKGIISGYADGSFRWQNDVVRGQIAKIVHGAVTAP